MGVGLAVAILLDATLVRAVLLPATMKLLGERNWYLPRQLRWLPKWEHEKAPEAAACLTSRAMRIGVLTGGGDCPGLNAVIRAIVRKGINAHGHEFVGFRYGWAGVLEERGDRPDARDARAGSCTAAGRSSGRPARTSYKVDGRRRPGARQAMKARNLDALIPIGGEDTLGVAGKLHEDGINVVGVPKTIDNDLAATDFTFGFQTAVQIATDAIDRLHTTAESHNRVIIVEVMGRHAGWIARLLRHRRRRRRDPDPRAPVRHRRGVRAHPAPPRGRRDVLDRRRRRGRDARRRRPDHRPPDDRRVRPRAPRRDRGHAREGDRGAHRASSRA